MEVPPAQSETSGREREEETGGRASIIDVAKRDAAAVSRSRLVWGTAVLLLGLTVPTFHGWVASDVLVETPFAAHDRLPILYYASVGGLASVVGHAAGPAELAAAGDSRWARLRRSDKVGGIRRVATAARSGLWTGPRRWATACIGIALTVIAYGVLVFLNPGVLNPVLLLLILGAIAGFVALADDPGGDGSRAVATGPPAPSDRRSAFLGRLLSRATILLAVVFLAYLLHGAIIVLELRAFDPVVYLANAATLFLFTVLWAAIAVGIAACTSSRRRAFAATLVLYVTANLTHFWHNTVSKTVGVILLGDAYDHLELNALESPFEETPGWALYVGWSNPFDGYVGVSNWLSVKLSSTHLLVDGEATAVFVGGDPVHVAYAVCVMVCWTVAFTALGYWQVGLGARH